MGRSKRPEAAPASRDRPPLVLVVDDDDDDDGVRAALRAALEDGGYGVATARDGDEALAAARSERPDVILLDLMMSNMSGWAFLSRYRRTPGPRAPVVVVSAIHAAVLDVVSLSKSGARAVVHKPFSVEELLETVGRQVDSSERAA